MACNTEHNFSLIVAYVQPARAPHAAAGHVGIPRTSAATSKASIPEFVEAPEAEVGASSLFLASCGAGALLGWLRSQRFGTNTMAATTAVTLAATPLMARAVSSDIGSSLSVAGGEEALFYTWILLATIITLVLTVVLREAPRI